jgi:NTP pyrophosphatase (non-canonical NTP hydrolase)
MKLNEYQEEARKTSTEKDWRESLILSSLGLAGETGEVIEKIKKVIRDKDYVITLEEKEEIKKEMGDVLWYLSQLGVVLDLSLEEIAKSNLEKIHSRHKRGVISGEGDNR